MSNSLYKKIYSVIEDDIEYRVYESFNGTMQWRFNDMVHRISGPAVEYSDGEEHWFFNDEFHRINGPAIVYSDGSVFWYLNGECFPSEEDYWIKVLDENYE